MKGPQLRGYVLGVAVLAAAIVSPLDGRRHEPTVNWDGLVLVPSTKRVDLVYLRPESDFLAYRKIMLDPPEIAYDRRWRRHYEATSRMLSMRLSDREIREMIDDGKEMLIEAYAAEFRRAGYEIVDQPDTDVLRLFVGLGNVRITAPKPQRHPGATFSEEVGQATLVLEARDSLSGTLLGRAVDQQVIADSIAMMRTESGNRGDFEYQFRDWAKLSAAGLDDLKSARPLR